MKTYGYCRISTKQQNIERQERNIKAAFPDAVITKESYTGCKLQGRQELEKILKVVKPGDTIIFDSVSRMSRNAVEGIELYETLYNKGIELVFLKEPHINTSVYRDSLNKNRLELTGDVIADEYLKATNNVLMILAKKQIELAFEQSQKEVDDLRQRTKEGIETARLNGKQIGQKTGAVFNVKKEAPAKTLIKKHNRDFNGNLSDADTISLINARIGISRNTYFKYKKELKAAN